MPRVASKAAQERRSAREKIHGLTKAALECKVIGHQWESDPGAMWHTPRYDYIRCHRFYFRCVRGCGSVKVAIYTDDGRWVSGFSRPPEANRVIGLGRGAGRAPFWQEYIERQQRTPSGQKRNRGADKTKTRRATA